MKKLLKSIVVLFIALSLFADYSVLAEEIVYEPNDPAVITVAAFPYLTNVDKFKELAVEMWAEIEPDVELAFVDWDCYLSSTPTADVFMYDALFIDSLVAENVVQPISASDIENAGDLLPFVLNGVYTDGLLYGIPNLTCAYHLIYYKDDSEVAAVDNPLDLYDVLISRSDNDSLLSDPKNSVVFDWGYTPFFYVEGLVDAASDPAAALDLTAITDPDVLGALAYLQDMRCVVPKEENPNYKYVDWFNRGFGCAYLGYSEDLLNCADIIDQLDIKLFSFSHKSDHPQYYVDVVSINSKVENPQKIELCKKLLNLLSSEKFIEALLLNDTNDLQFMMPARLSVWDTVRNLHPLYSRLYEYIIQEENTVTRYSSMANDYFSIAYTNLDELIEDYR